MMTFDEWLQNMATNYNFDDFKQFIVSNGIIGTAAGVIIAYAAWDLIKSLVGDMILPSLYFLLIHPWLGKIEAVSLIFAPIEKIDFPNFTKTIISFVIMIVIAFFSIHYITLNWIPENIHTSSESNMTTASQQTPEEQTPVTNYYTPFQTY